jgi:hypothetical protein
MPDAHPGLVAPAAPLSTFQEESSMNRSISLTLVLVAALASQVGCSKKEDVGTPSADATASAPDSSASGAMMAASAAPMDSISSASAVAGAGADAASSPASAASQ